MGDFNKAMVAAARVFQLLDRKPMIDTNPSVGLKLNQVDGNVKLRDAEFTYPTRQNIQILNRLNLSLKAGESIALVGESGCGKSTVIQLIQRFYDVNQGSLELEGNNIQSLNLPYVRSRLGIVSQEQVLFDRSIAENIQYGDNERTVSMEEVIDAARKANIHNFVAALPEGYNTKVGGKGTQLSGGQKQRVAIARALVPTQGSCCLTRPRPPWTRRVRRWCRTPSTPRKLEEPPSRSRTGSPPSRGPTRSTS